MDLIFNNILTTGNYFYLCGLIIGSFLFAMIGIRESKAGQIQGILYVAISVFFFCINALYLLSEVNSGLFEGIHSGFSILGWIIFLAGPAVIILYSAFAIFNLIKLDYGIASVKMVIAFMLYGIIYTLGDDISNWIKAAAVLLFTLLWFSIEIKSVDETS
ncbi:MAG: hypothetical protein ABIJ45_01090 [Candidatus Zixiibacteriota bacterium]